MNVIVIVNLIVNDFIFPGEKCILDKEKISIKYHEHICQLFKIWPQKFSDVELNSLKLKPSIKLNWK